MKTHTAKNTFRLAASVVALLFLSGLFFQGHLEMKQMEWPRLAATLRLASYAVYYLAVAGGLWLAWSLLARLGRWATPLLETQEAEIAVPEPAVPAPQEAGPIKQAMDNLASLLATLEPNVQEADARLMDARQWTGTLVSQVLRVVEKIEEMETQAGSLGEAIEAINSGQRDKVAYAAGKVTDPAIKELLRSPYIVRRPEFRADAITLISGEIGTLEQWGRAYGDFVTVLFTQLSQVRDRAAMLQAGRDMLEVSRPVLQIRAGLDEAETALQLRAAPALRMIGREALPTSQLLQ